MRPNIRGFHQVYQDHLWYPILVKFPGCGYTHIIEMQGREVNAWNKMIEDQYGGINLHPDEIAKRKARWPMYKQWTTGVTSDGRVYIQDDNFTWDARLYVNGDFFDQEAEMAYAEQVAAMLNNKE